MLLLLCFLGCGNPDCPTGRPLTDADLTCDCGSQPVDALTCEDLYCTEDGAIIGSGGCS